MSHDVIDAMYGYGNSDVNTLYNHRFILRNEVEHLYSLVQRWKKAIEGLTPSGSEYVDDPENCAAFIRRSTQYPRIVIETRKERDEARAQLEQERTEYEYATNRHKEDVASLQRIIDASQAEVARLNTAEEELAAKCRNAESALEIVTQERGTFLDQLKAAEQGQATLIREIERLTKERDEAREEIMRQEGMLGHEQVRYVQTAQQLDEARAEIERLKEIERCAKYSRESTEQLMDEVCQHVGAAICEKCQKHCVPGGWMAIVRQYDIAIRARDESCAEVERLKQVTLSPVANAINAQGDYVAQLTRERDEAREALLTTNHIANEWADMAANGIQWLKNIQDGSTTDMGVAITEMQSNAARIRELIAEGNVKP